MYRPKQFVTMGIRPHVLVGCILALACLIPSGQALAEDLTTYGREWNRIKDGIESARKAYETEKFLAEHLPSGPEREARLKNAETQYRDRMKEWGARRDRIHQKVIEEAGKRTAGGTTDASAPIEATKGTKPGEKGFRGMEGDLDAGGGSRTAQKVQDVLDDMGIKIQGKARGGTIEFGDDFNLTVHKQGKMDAIGSGAYQAQIGVDAKNPESFVSEGMGKSQVGRKAVEVQDHIKKARKAFNTDPAEIAHNPDLQQKMAKSTKKIMETDTLADNEIRKILDKSGSTESVKDFKDRMERIKEGRAKPDDLTPENAEATQKACKEIAETASEKSTAKARQDMAEFEKTVEGLEKKGDSASKQKARKMREELVDSRERLNQTRRANLEPVEELTAEPARKAKPGRTFDAKGNEIKPQGPEVESRSAGKKPGKPQAPEAEGPDAPKGGEGLGGKIERVAGEYMDGAVIIGQTGKIREGIKESDPKKVLEGLGGKDIADRSDVQGGKDYADDMGKLLDAKTAEAEAAAVGKLKRMGATDQEIAEYRKNYNEDPGKARAVVEQVKSRGGKDTAPRKGLEGVGPEDDAWTAKEQLTEGARQAGSYGKTVLDGVSLGNVTRGEEAEADLSDMVRQAEHVDQKTAERVISTLYTELRDRGASPEEAKAALKDYFKNPRDVRELAAELKERDSEKAKGTGRRKEGLSVDNVVVEKDDDGAGARIKETFVEAGKGVKDMLVDKPVSVVNDTINDIMDATGIGSAKNESERSTVEQTELAEIGEKQIYDRLIRNGATPDEARRAIEPMAKGSNRELHELQEKLRARNKQREKEKTAEAKASEKRGDEARKIFAPKDPATSDRKDIAGQDGPKKVPTDSKREDSGPVNDSGQRVDAGAYQQGDRIITQDGTEWEKRGSGWARTGEKYEPYTPEDKTGGASSLRGAEPSADANVDISMATAGYKTADRLSARWSEAQEYRGSQGAATMAQNAQMAESANSGNQQIRDAQNAMDAAGRDAGMTKEAAARDANRAAREQGWGKVIGDAVESGITEGGKAFGQAIGQGAADRVAGQIFGSDKKPEVASGHDAEDKSSSASGADAKTKTASIASSGHSSKGGAKSAGSGLTVSSGPHRPEGGEKHEGEDKEKGVSSYESGDSGRKIANAGSSSDSGSAQKDETSSVGQGGSSRGKAKGGSGGGGEGGEVKPTKWYCPACKRFIRESVEHPGRCPYCVTMTCPKCGYSAVYDRGSEPAYCPRCGPPPVRERGGE